MKPLNHLPRRRQRASRGAIHGFTLIELMVGMVIAMIGVIIMMETLLQSEERGRTITGGNDALSGGAVMVHVLQRDLMQAGYGLNSTKLLGCNITIPTGATIPIAPVVVNAATTLVPAGDANTDTVLTFYGNDSGQPEGNPIYSITGAVYAVQAPQAFAVGDYVVAAPDTCAASLVLTQITAVDATTVTVGTATAGATALFNLGRNPRIIAYAVHDGQLTSCNFLADDCRTYNATRWAAVSGNIPSLRAVYGRDTASGTMDGRVDDYDQTTPTDMCGWARVSAARVVVVARSNQYETKIDSGTGQRVCEAVTASAPAWTGASAAPLVLSGQSDWQCYRYRTFESLAPLRNVIWMGAVPSC